MNTGNIDESTLLDVSSRIKTSEILKDTDTSESQYNTKKVIETPNGFVFLAASKDGLATGLFVPNSSYFNTLFSMGLFMFAVSFISAVILSAILIAVRENKKKFVSESIKNSELFASVSYEMYKPLNEIIYSIENSLQENNPNIVQEKLLIMHHSATILNNSVKDVFDFSKINAGISKAENSPYDIKLMLKEFTETANGKISGKPFLLLTEFSPLLPGIVQGDISRVSQIIVNVFNKVVENAPKEYVKLSVNAEYIGKVIKLLFTFSNVSDRGFFEDFVNDDGKLTDTADSSNYENKKIGSNITKHIIDMLDGDLSVTDDGICITIPQEFFSEEHIIKPVRRELETMTIDGKVKPFRALILEQAECLADSFIANLQMLNIEPFLADNLNVFFAELNTNTYDYAFFDLSFIEQVFNNNFETDTKLIAVVNPDDNVFYNIDKAIRPINCISLEKVLEYANPS
jgi:hypothetical protein